jgi:hypothetical protein
MTANNPLCSGAPSVKAAFRTPSRRDYFRRTHHPIMRR